MNQLQLPVDVHFVVEDDGRSFLLVGGLAMPFQAAKLPEVLSSARLKQGKKRREPAPPPKAKKVKLRVVKGGKKAGTVQHKSPEWIANIAKANKKRAEERAKKNLCLRCDDKPEQGKKLCVKCIAKTARATSAGKKAA